MAKVPDVELKLPSNADLDRMMSVVERMWKRLVEMIEQSAKGHAAEDLRGQ